MENNNELSKGTKIKIAVITVLVILTTIAGISYAFFSIGVTGNEEASSVTVTAALLRLSYTDNLSIGGSGIYPGWSQSKTVTVQNTGTDTVYYKIIWRELLNQITNNELTISATCSSSSGSCEGITEQAIPTQLSQVTNQTIKNGISIAPNVTHTYTVTVTFKEMSSAQNYNQGKSFYGTLNIAEGEIARTPIVLNTRQSYDGLTMGDTVSIGTEDFYVVSSNASETVLLAKYNLLVGDTYNGVYTPISTEASGYGLQSSTAKGWVDGANPRVGVVPFSGTNYWDNEVCQYTNASWSCTGTSSLNSEYATNGASYSGNSFPYVYNSTMSTTAPTYYTSGNSKYIQNNGYTIAYYVEPYLEKLNISNASIRLLTYEEIDTIKGREWPYTASYWLGSARGSVSVWDVNYDGSVNGSYFRVASSNGVRPVVEVLTSNINVDGATKVSVEQDTHQQSGGPGIGGGSN